MYQLKIIQLQQGEQKRERLVIEFDDPNMVIVAEFLMADAPLIKGKIATEIAQVLSGESPPIKTSGNRCAVEIKQDVTTISDLFADLDEDVAVLPTAVLETSQVQQLIQEWFHALDDFRKRSK